MVAKENDKKYHFAKRIDVELVNLKRSVIMKNVEERKKAGV